MPSVNHSLILIEGKSATGKSAALRNLVDPPGVMMLNCEAGKELPFKANFGGGTIVNTDKVYAAFVAAEKDPKVHTIIIDSITFLMDMYETTRVIPSPDGRKAWGAYAQYFKKLMMKYVAESSKNVIIIGHTSDIYNDKEMVTETRVKVKGSLMTLGIEAFFCNVIAAKRMPVKSLEDYTNPLLVITPEEEILGFKYVFQTQLTKDTINESIRGPMGLWNRDYTFIDNDIQKVLDHLHAYYK
jgi:hypothetical protein